MSEELSHNDIGVASDKMEVPPVVRVVQPMVATRAIVALKFTGRRMAEKDYLKTEEKEVVTQKVVGGMRDCFGYRVIATVCERVHFLAFV